MELKDLQYFIVVGEELHFARAAARLHIVPAAVSQRIRGLERELGVRLFERTSRSVRLTSAGERLLVNARTIVSGVGDMTALARALGAGASDQVALGFSPNLSPFVARFLAAIVDAHPGLDIVGRSMWGAEALAGVRSGALTAALVRGPVTEAGLVVVAFGSYEDSFLAVPAGDALARRRRISLTALEGRAVLVNERDAAPRIHDTTVQFFAEYGVAPLWRHHRVQEYEQEMTLVAAGVGATLVHSHQATTSYPGVVIRPLVQPGPRYDLQVMCRSADTSAVARTIRTLQAPG